MKLKKILYPLILLAITALTSCNKDDSPTLEGSSDVMFNFYASLPDAITQTRTVTINRYILEVYKTAEPNTLIQRVEQAGSSIVLSLDANTHYTCLFWADGVTANDNTNGTYDASSLKAVTLNAGKEMDDAFVTRLDITDATTTFNVTLSRASAKINMVATGSVAANTDLTVTYNEYRSFNTLTSEVAGATVSTSKTFNSSATTGILGTFLTFASASGVLTNFSTLYNSTVQNDMINTPLKTNYITNIRGDYTAGGKDFTILVTVDQVWVDVIDGVEINVGTVANPKWIKVADRNADKNGPNGATLDAGANEYGGNYEWSNATNSPTNAEGAYRACFDFGQGYGRWRLPTAAELIAMSGNGGTSHAVDGNRKLKWDGGPAWKMYDERPGQEANFVYFPMGGYTVLAGTFLTHYKGEIGWYWASTFTSSNSAMHYMYFNQNGSSTVLSQNLPFYTSIRCVRDI